MRRVLVIGSGGSGKSTLAREMAARIGLPVIHLDREYWSAGWVAPRADVWARKVAALLARDAWIMDGNYSGTIEERLAACDTVVFLDLSRVLCLLRVVIRRMRFRGTSRPDIAAHCPEQLTWEFIRWIWTYPRRRRPRILERLSTVASEKRIVILRSRADVRAFLDSLQNGGTDGTDAVES